jgi:hypothetical protein
MALESIGTRTVSDAAPWRACMHDTLAEAPTSVLNSLETFLFFKSSP